MTDRPRLRLHSADLYAIARAVEKLNESGVRVESAVIVGHRVTLGWTDDQREGTYYTVTNIEPEGS